MSFSGILAFDNIAASLVCLGLVSEALRLSRRRRRKLRGQEKPVPVRRD